MSSVTWRLFVFWLGLVGKVVYASSPTASPSTIRSSQNSIVTIAGTGATSSTGTGGVATAMTLYNPEGVWVTSIGTVYVAEYSGYCVRKFSYPNGIVFAVAGVPGSTGSTGDNGPATSAQLYSLWGVVVDTLGVVYITEYSNHKVRMVSVSGVITTIAGTGATSNNGDNGPASSASVYGPRGLWMDSLYQLYLTSYYGSSVRRIGSDVNRIITTIAGVAGSAAFSGDGGPATSATLLYPNYVFVDSVGVVYIGDTNNYRVRKMTTGGIISTVIGTGSTTYNGDQPGTSCNLNTPNGVVVDPSNGDIYVASYDNKLVQVLVASSGIVTVFAGNQNSAYSGESVAATSAGVYPVDLFLDTNSRLFITDYNNERLRMTYPTNPTMVPTLVPSIEPTVFPSLSPSVIPSFVPSTTAPSLLPSYLPTQLPTTLPTLLPSVAPSVMPSAAPSTVQPSIVPTVIPSVSPSLSPTVVPTTILPSVMPSVSPSVNPSVSPTTTQPSVIPSLLPTTTVPSVAPSVVPTMQPSLVPSVLPSLVPSVVPSVNPTLHPSVGPSTIMPSVMPTAGPTVSPSLIPSVSPSLTPTQIPTVPTTMVPTTIVPTTVVPTLAPSKLPTVVPTVVPSVIPTVLPTLQPSVAASACPSVVPSKAPTMTPTVKPSVAPSMAPSVVPTVSSLPSSAPAAFIPTVTPTVKPSYEPSVSPTEEPTIQPSTGPSVVPSASPSRSPTILPSKVPTLVPSVVRTELPTELPSVLPSVVPTDLPTELPSVLPSVVPTELPTALPTVLPSVVPSVKPTVQPSCIPSVAPSVTPTLAPTREPSVRPSTEPSSDPTSRPSSHPSAFPTQSPTGQPSVRPSHRPSSEPTSQPSEQPCATPSSKPSSQPSSRPSDQPNTAPTSLPTAVPSGSPTMSPTTYQYLLTHPLGTLPSNKSISVVGAEKLFKIVLPYGLVAATGQQEAYTDIELSVGKAGKMYVVEGSASMPGSVDLPSSHSSVMTITSGLSYDSFGRSASNLKDFNGDGFDDLIIGDPFKARCYVLFGTSQGLVNMTEGFTIFGEQDSDLTGWSVSGARDVNNDTFHDIVLGAPNVRGVGAVYVVYGHKAVWDVKLSDLTPEKGFAVYGNTIGDLLGVSVSNAGDVNGDGFDDVIAGALLTANLLSGSAYVLFGSTQIKAASTRVVDYMSANGGWQAVGVSFSRTGYSVAAAGDVNRDGFDDVLVGTSPYRASLQTSAYLLFGSNRTRSDTLVLSELSVKDGIEITGGGTIVSEVGDVNHDGFSDVMVVSLDSASIRSGLVVYLPAGYSSYSPTRQPSRSPSVKPSARPSVPLFKTGAIPTSLPSSSQPTARFTTSQPTSRPSLVPSVVPTLNPVLSTSLPIALPPHVELTHSPFTNRPIAPPHAIPTMKPSEVVLIQSYLIQIQSNDTQELVASRTDKDTHFTVNATVDVQIELSGGCDTFTVVPIAGVTLFIRNFNLSCDVIDLTPCFPRISAMKDLKYTTVNNSVDITLLNDQHIRLQTLVSKHELQSHNFMFGVDNSGYKPDATYKAIYPVMFGTFLGSFAAGLIFWIGSTWLGRRQSVIELEEAEKIVDRLVMRRSGVKGNAVKRDRQERRIVVHEYVMTLEKLSRWDRKTLKLRTLRSQKNQLLVSGSDGKQMVLTLGCEDGSDSISSAGDDDDGSDISFNPIADVLNDIEEELMVQEPEAEVLEALDAEKMKYGPAATNPVKALWMVDGVNDVSGSDVSYRSWETLLNENSQGGFDDFSMANSEMSRDPIEEMINRMEQDESSDSDSALSDLSEL